MIAFRHIWILGLAAALGVSGVEASFAQRTPKAEKAETAPAEAPKAPAEAPKAEAPSNAQFMQPLGRLASILGSVHFLRELCGDANADVWRDKMNDMIAAQAPNGADKEILIASFNSGYRAFASVYRRCTPAARLAVSRYQEEGATLSRDIAGRYGN